MSSYTALTNTTAGWVMNNRNLFVNSESWQIWCLVRFHFLIHRWPAFAVCPYMVEGMRKASEVSFMRAPPSWTNYLKPHLGSWDLNTGIQTTPASKTKSQ